jgi:hypothetical protein
VKINIVPKYRLFFFSLICAGALACLGSGCSLVPFLNPTPTPTPTNTASPSPTLTETPTATVTPSNTPTPTSTNTPTPKPSLTKRPTATKILATPTASMVELKIINNLAQNVKLTLTGPTNKSFTVQAHSTFVAQLLPGDYSYQFEAVNFISQKGWIAIPPGPGTFTWTWGKAKQ